jgi:hypothetical protein
LDQHDPSLHTLLSVILKTKFEKSHSSTMRYSLPRGYCLLCVYSCLVTAIIEVTGVFFVEVTAEVGEDSDRLIGGLSFVKRGTQVVVQLVRFPNNAR